MEFSTNLKKIRKSRGISGRAFANLMGIKYSTYISYEIYKREPRYEVLCKIADALQVSTDELLGRKLGATYMEKYFNLKEKIMKLSEEE